MSCIKGLGDYHKELSQSGAFRELDSAAAKIAFNPHDEESIEAAVGEIESAIDAKFAPYRGNPLVPGIVVKLRERYRDAILKRAEAVRGGGAGEGAQPAA